eukprot:TRINITY_DN944_c1_g1_i1.p1 TRINITY_DN944_c1_g1~~TRINITY_DN944_c1_g1_i1.p1  ORF type:complete len:514 (+),score=155.02 TRINITY_DN944_c1_g1_i1:57-1544(+)
MNWLLLVGLLLVISYLGWLVYMKATLKAGEPPLIHGYIPYLGVTIQFGKDGVGFLRRCQKEYGDVFTLIILGQRTTFLMHQDNYKMMFRSSKSLSFDPIEHKINVDVFGVPEKEAKIDTTVLRKQYHEHLMKPDNLCELNARMRENLEKYIDNWIQIKQAKNESTFLLREFIQDAMFVSGTSTVFSPHLADPKIRSHFENFDSKFPALAAGLPISLSGVAQSQSSLISSIRTATADPLISDSSDLIRQRQDYFSSTMSPQGAASAQFGLFWALQANAIPATFWALYFTLHNSTARNAVTTEIQSITAKIKENLDSDFSASFSSPNFEKYLPEMKNVESLVNEVLRVTISVLILRYAMEEVVLGLETEEGKKDFLFRKGAKVVMAVEMMHRDEEIFERETEFQWDRFLAKEGGGKKEFYKKGKRVERPLLPFGGGASMCPGRDFAMNEIKLLLLTIMSKLDLELVNNEELKRDQTRFGCGVLPPVHDVVCRFKPKK